MHIGTVATTQNIYLVLAIGDKGTLNLPAVGRMVYDMVRQRHVASVGGGMCEDYVHLLGGLF